MVSEAARSSSDPSDTVPDLPRDSAPTMDVLDSELLPNETSGKRVRPDATVKGIGPAEAHVVYTLKPLPKPERVTLAEEVREVRRAEESAEEEFTWLEKDKTFLRTISASALGLIACVLLIVWSGGSHEVKKPASEPMQLTQEVQAPPTAEVPVMAAPAAPSAPTPEPVAKATPFPEAEQAASAPAKVLSKKKGARVKVATRPQVRAKTPPRKAVTEKKVAAPRARTLR